MNPFIFYNCIIATVLQLLHDSYPPIRTIVSSKQANYATKTESVKNRTVCSNLNKTHNSEPLKILKT